MHPKVRWPDSSPRSGVAMAILPPPPGSYAHVVAVESALML